MSTVALIDYGSGTLASAAKALARAAEGTRHEIVTTADTSDILAAERIVLPGVGAFADCMRGLSSIPGMVPALRERVLKERGAARTRPQPTDRHIGMRIPHQGHWRTGRNRNPGRHPLRILEIRRHNPHHFIV